MRIHVRLASLASCTLYVITSGVGVGVGVGEGEVVVVGVESAEE